MKIKFPIFFVFLCTNVLASDAFIVNSDTLMQVFHQDSLAKRMLKAEEKRHHSHHFGFPIKNKKKLTAVQKKLWAQQILDRLSSALPFENNLALGSESNHEAYLEMNAEKTWMFTPNFNLVASQVIRYGTQNKSYAETDFNFTQKESSKAFASNNFSVIKTYEEEITWDDRLYRQQDIMNDNRLTYGVYSSGVYNKQTKDIDIQSWGPYFAWRHPLWRDRFYIENEVSYYKDASMIDGYSVSVAIKLEATF